MTTRLPVASRKAPLREQIRELYLRGEKLVVIETLLGVTPSQVAYALRGVPRTHYAATRLRPVLAAVDREAFKAHWDSPLTLEDLGLIYQVSAATISRTGKRLGLPSRAARSLKNLDAYKAPRKGTSTP